MGFLTKDLKKPASSPRRFVASGRIPIESLNRAGCSVCPRDSDRSLRSPKMAPEGPQGASVYLLGLRPTPAEDDRGGAWSGPAGREVIDKLGRSFVDRHCRVGHVLQCAPADEAGMAQVDVRELECCRGRVAEDIARAAPLLVVGVGDAPLEWATGLKGSHAFRGTLIATRIGGHACWYLPLLYPNWTNNGGKRRRGSEYELTLEHDCRRVRELAGSDLKPPRIHGAPYDAGVECITGQGHGDVVRLEEAAHWLSSQPRVGYDIETNGLSPAMLPEPRIWTAALGTFERAFAFCVDHPDGWGTERRQRHAMGVLGEVLARGGTKVCHNLAFEQEWSAWFFGEQLLRRTDWDDTMARAYVLDARKGTKSLGTQTRVRFGFDLKAQSPVDASQPDWVRRHPVGAVLRYNGMDAKWTEYLDRDQRLSMLSEEESLHRVYEGRVRLAPTLVMTRGRGLPADLDYARALLDDVRGQLRAVEARLARCPEVSAYRDRFGRKHGPFSPTNPDDVLRLLRDVLGREEARKEDYSGKVSYSTDDDVLSSLPPAEVPSAPLIQEHRALTRCDTTYLTPVLAGNKIVAPDGMIHAEYSSLHTVTNRLSSEMHNWPKHKHREVRGVVFAPEGHWMVAADMGQIEFRVAGMLSGDDNLVRYCWTGYDVHAYWAQRFVKLYGPIKDFIVEEYKVDWDEKGLKTLRQHAKNNWVFPQLFGSLWQSCARNMHVPDDIAERAAREFWDEFPGVQRWQEDTMRFYERNLYVETMGGFRRRGPTSRNEVINLPIQGTACELVLESMNALSEAADADGTPHLQPAFNGHDDLTFIVPDAELESSVNAIATEMSRPRFEYVNVPLVVEVSVGRRWHELEEVGKFSSADLFNLRNPYEGQDGREKKGGR